MQAGLDLVCATDQGAHAKRATSLLLAAPDFEARDIHYGQ